MHSGSEIPHNEGLFQAFLGATPRHPLIRTALRNTVSYYEAVAQGDHAAAKRFTGSFKHGNIGPSILMTAFANYSDITTTTGVLSTALNATQIMQHNKEHVSQLFLEASLSRYDKTWTIPNSTSPLAGLWQNGQSIFLREIWKDLPGNKTWKEMRYVCKDTAHENDSFSITISNRIFAMWRKSNIAIWVVPKWAGRIGDRPGLVIS